jgi:hypothetical protein
MGGGLGDLGWQARGGGGGGGGGGGVVTEQGAGTALLAQLASTKKKAAAAQQAPAPAPAPTLAQQADAEEDPLAWLTKPRPTAGVALPGLADPTAAAADDALSFFVAAGQ